MPAGRTAGIVRCRTVGCDFKERQPTDECRHAGAEYSAGRRQEPVKSLPHVFGGAHALPWHRKGKGHSAQMRGRIVAPDRQNRSKRGCLSDAQSVAAYYMEYLRHEPQEQLLVSMFDSKCHLIGDTVIATGSARAVLCSPREIFLRLLEKKAVYFILLHNHPSGDPSPSREDCELTKRVKACGELMDVELSDHIIIGDNRYYSFRENKQILV